VTAPEVDPQEVINKFHVSLKRFAQLGIGMEEVMASMGDLMSEITRLQSGQTEMLKDVRRLIQAGDTSAAISQLDQVITANEQLDSEVEAASPEPTEPPAPTDESAPQ
jgi:hypothetical protein